MRKLKGTVVSNKMLKTVVVRVDRLEKHPKYLKYSRRSKKFKAHADDAANYHIGDLVRIQETRPLSKDKRWKVVEVVGRAPQLENGVETENSAEVQDSKLEA